MVYVHFDQDSGHLSVCRVQINTIHRDKSTQGVAYRHERRLHSTSEWGGLEGAPTGGASENNRGQVESNTPSFYHETVASHNPPVF
jgi:hypothetical protein